MVRVTDRVEVEFGGEGAGIEELSWGQLELWAAIQRQRSWLPIGATSPVAPGTTVDEVVAELRFMMSRYQTMRTRLRLGPSGPRQVVAGRGSVPLEIVDAEADPAQVAAAVEERFRDTGYDFTSEWPVRMAVVRHRGVPTHQVTVMCHLVTDGAGAAVIARDLAGRDPASGAAAPVTGMPPMAQARWQRTPAARRVSDAALRRWEGLLRTVTPDRFPGTADPREPRNWEGRLDSAALLLAVQRLSRRTRVDTSTLLLTCFAVALGRVTGISPVVVQVVVSNRFRPGLAETVSPVNQTGLCLLDVSDMTIDQAVASARRRMMAVYKHAYYDPRRLDELIARVEREREEDLDLACYFNDRRLDRDPTTGASPTPAQVRTAQVHTRFRWTRRVDYSFERLFVHIEDVPDRIAVTIAGDTHYVSPANLESCVRGMEAVAVAAAADPASPTRVTRPASAVAPARCA